MKPDFTKPRSSDDSVLQDIRRTNQPKSPLDHLDLATRHEIFYRKVDQGDPAQRESQEHQDLKKRAESLRRDLQDYKLANAYYKTYKNDPNHPTIGDYNLFAENFNARQEKFAKETPLKLKLIKTSLDSESSSSDLHTNANLDQNTLTLDRSEKADHYAEIRSEKQRKSAKNWTQKFMRVATAAAYYTITRLDVTTAAPIPGYHHSWNDTSNNIGNISKRQQLFNGTDFNNTAFLLQEVQSDPQFAWNAFQNKDFVKKALDNQGLVDFITNKGAVVGTSLAITAGGALIGSLLTRHFANRARSREQALHNDQHELQNRANVKTTNVTGFNAAIQQDTVNAANIANAYNAANIDLN